MNLTIKQREFLEVLTRGPTCLNQTPAGVAAGLSRRGLIRKVGFVGNQNKYEITDAGREAGMSAAWNSDPRR